MASYGTAPIGKKLLQLKEDLERKKAQRSELQGELKGLMRQLSALGCDTVEAAQRLIQVESEAIQKMEEEIREGLLAIEKLMNAHA